MALSIEEEDPRRMIEGTVRGSSTHMPQALITEPTPGWLSGEKMPGGRMRTKSRA